MVVYSDRGCFAAKIKKPWALSMNMPENQVKVNLKLANYARFTQGKISIAATISVLSATMRASGARRASSG